MAGSARYTLCIIFAWQYVAFKVIHLHVGSSLSQMT